MYVIMRPNIRPMVSPRPNPESLNPFRPISTEYGASCFVSRLGVAEGEAVGVGEGEGEGVGVGVGVGVGDGVGDGVERFVGLLI